uniref:hypothetical protein n=1 Tax=Mesomycoplasma ovipneumoniae TaxID=29562 RepID=UPI00307FFBD2
NLDSLYINPYEQIYNIKEKIQNACQSICPDFNIAGGAKNGVKMLLYAYNQFDDSVPLYEPTDYRGRGRYENQKRWEQQFLDMERRWQQMANKINKMEQELREIRRDKLIH